MQKSAMHHQFFHDHACCFHLPITAFTMADFDATNSMLRTPCARPLRAPGHQDPGKIARTGIEFQHPLALTSRHLSHVLQQGKVLITLGLAEYKGSSSHAGALDAAGGRVGDGRRDPGGGATVGSRRGARRGLGDAQGCEHVQAQRENFLKHP